MNHWIIHKHHSNEPIHQNQKDIQNNMAKQQNPMWLTGFMQFPRVMFYIYQACRQGNRWTSTSRTSLQICTVHVSKSLNYWKVSYSHSNLQRRPVCLCVTMSSFSNGQPHQKALSASSILRGSLVLCCTDSVCECSVTAVRGLFWLSFERYVHGKVLYKKIQAFSVLLAAVHRISDTLLSGVDQQK